MVDSLDQERRSGNMRSIRSKDTKPEMLVRRLLTEMGFRYRLHRKNLPGKPDIVFAGKKKIIFVHGCFWHRHSECREGRLPGSKLEYWLPKLQGNVERDARRRAQLSLLGWDVIVVWECQTEDRAALIVSLRRFLEN
jgi:DNA mismatch endonuclease (patch repair protein)